MPTSLLGDRAAAEDVVQEALLGLCKRWSRLRDPTSAATRNAAAVITPGSVPPLRLAESPGRQRPARRTRMAWFVPLAAAAAVAAVVLGGTAAGSWLTRPGDGRPAVGGPGTGADAGAWTDAVPAYYVALQDASYASVRSTATGAVLARIKTHVPFVGVTGSVDDRTFVLDAQRSIMGPTVKWPGQPAFYLLRLSASGTEQSLTRIAFPALPKGTVVTGLALSPDGGRLAVAVDAGLTSKPGLQEIMISTLATGAVRTWSATGSLVLEDPGGFTGSGVDGPETISWTADGKTLAFDWANQSWEVGVRLLDTAASGDNLTADSRLAAIETLPPRAPVSKGKDHASQCVSASIITPDGSSIVCQYWTTIGGGPFAKGPTSYTPGFLQYSTTTGKMRVLSVFTYPGEGPGGENSLYWTGPDGKTLIASIATPRGIQLGIVSGETFKPLPGITSLGGAAW